MNWKALLQTIAVGAAGAAIGAAGEGLKPSGVDLTPFLPALAGIIGLLIKNPWQKPAGTPPIGQSTKLPPNVH